MKDDFTEYDHPDRDKPASMWRAHLIVIRTDGRRRPGKHGRRGLYRHATEEKAVAEAKRLAALRPGNLFVVYGAGARYIVNLETAELVGGTPR